VIGKVFQVKPACAQSFYLFLFFLFLFKFNSICFSQELLVYGLYQGKNIYVQNSFDPVTKQFGTKEILINGRSISADLKSSAFEIDLSFFQIEEFVSVQIKHKPSLQPRIVNPHALKEDFSFRFLVAEINDSDVRWVSKGEFPRSTYFIEQYFDEKWNPVESVKALGSESKIEYNVESIHRSSNNKYRIKFQVPNGENYFSHTIEFSSVTKGGAFYFSTIKDRQTADEAEEAYHQQKGKNNLKRSKKSTREIDKPK
jgi:hypothetical protein